MNILKLPALLLLIYSTCIRAQNFSYIDFSQFKEGDLLFQDLDCGELCDAIEKVTQGHQGLNVSHVGMVVKHKDSLWVIEAYSKKVALISLPDFMGRTVNSDGDPKVFGGRLRSGYGNLARKASEESKIYLGLPYDDSFASGLDKIYCSELIYYTYKFANKNIEVFPLQPMTFKDPDTGVTLPAWENYFSELKMKVPENELGCNPAGISRSDKLDIFFSFGDFLKSEKEKRKENE
ncbi:MAG: YiiX/YebB-like N1pC/P60 family cysteine hydrolase [Bacteroidota bacterium]|jgi:hypothetical protein